MKRIRFDLVSSITALDQTVAAALPGSSLAAYVVDLRFEPILCNKFA